jgi:16S rRNA (uracil1498-N3)-methyltransferase
MSSAIMAERIATRLYLAEPLAAGRSVALGPPAVHRLRDVLRLGPGAAVAAFNPRDGEWLCRIAEMTRGRATLDIAARRRPPEDEADLWLLFAPIRRTRLDWLVEKASELGATALIPIATARTQAPQINRDRLAAVAIAAAEQCERLSVPEVRPAEPLDHIIAQWPGERRLILCDESGGGRPMAEALVGWPPGAPAALLVGPEGGFADRELDALGKLPIVTRVGLGPRVLRAETAAVAALAAFQAIGGDWRRALAR